MQINTLPSTRFTLNDGTVTTTPPPDNGSTIIIVGQALDGPENYPISLAALTQDLATVFGPTTYDVNYASPDGDATKLGDYSGNNLVASIHEAINGGAGNIIIVRVGGNFATDSVNTLLGGIVASSQFPSAIYNGSTVTAVAASGGITISCTQPAIKGPSFSVTFDAHTTFDKAAAMFNADGRNGTFKLVCPLSIATNTATSNPSASVTATLAGGTYGTLLDDYSTDAGKIALYTAVTDPNTGIFSEIDGWQANFLYVAGIYADDDISGTSTASFATDLATFCYTQSQESYPMHGFIGVQPLLNNTQSAIRARVATLMSTTTGYANTSPKQLHIGQFIENGIEYVDTNSGATVDIGRDLSIHVGPDVIFQDPKRGPYINNPAAYYAGLISALPVQIGATNQPVNVVSPAYLYTRNQLKQLDAGIGATLNPNQQGGGAYVTFKQANQVPGNTSIRVTDDVTAAKRSSFYANLQAIRICNQADSVVGQVCNLFLGQPNNAATITAMQSQIRTALDTMAGNGCFNGAYGTGYKFTVATNPTGSLGSVTVAMQIKPAFQIRFIDVNTTVTL